MVERPDLPLFAWGDALRAARFRRRALLRRAVAIGFGSAALSTTIAWAPRPRLVWNASASAPVGLYVVTPGAPIARGDMVIAWPPMRVRDLAARRTYLPRGVPLIKRVAAVAGDTICGAGSVVTVNGRPAATRRAADALGRPLPSWWGCIRLDPGMFLLLMTGSPDSFDGRNFGPSSASDIIGQATPIWTR